MRSEHAKLFTGDIVKASCPFDSASRFGKLLNPGLSAANQNLQPQIE
jgi:hypothetical protein